MSGIYRDFWRTIQLAVVYLQQLVNRKLWIEFLFYGIVHILYSFIATLFLSNPFFFFFEIYEIDIYYEISMCNQMVTSEIRE